MHQYNQARRALVVTCHPLGPAAWVYRVKSFPAMVLRLVEGNVDEKRVAAYQEPYEGFNGIHPKPHVNISGPGNRTTASVVRVDTGGIDKS
jgi:hypothetical protein